MKVPIWIRCVLLIATWVLPTRADIIWPSENDWRALRIGTGYYYDTEGDTNPSPIDLIGTTDTYSAGYWAYAINGYVNGPSLEDAFMLRMRVGGPSGNYVWQALLDTDGDATNVEWILELVQSGSGSGVALVQTAVGGSTIGAIDIGSNPRAWSGSLAEFSRWSAISDSTHYHVDFSIPWSDFSLITGITDPGQMRIVLSTSTTHANVINGDSPLGGSLGEQVSNILSENIPEPAVASLLIGAGTGIIICRRIFPQLTHLEKESST